MFFQTLGKGRKNSRKRKKGGLPSVLYRAFCGQFSPTYQSIHGIHQIKDVHYEHRDRMGCSLDDKADPHHYSKNIENNPEIPLLDKSHGHQCLGYHTEHRCESVYPRLACIGIFKKQSEDNRADDTNCRNDNQLGHRETAGFETFLC